MVREATNPYLSPSRAVVPARERAKRRQGCMWAGLMSNEMLVVRSAEAVILAEGHAARTVMVRSGRAPRCLRTQARMYVQTRDLGGLPVTTVRCTVVAEAKAGADRRKNGGEESDTGIVPMKAVNKAWVFHVAESVEGRPGRNGRREGTATLRTQSREAPSWVSSWIGTE